MEVPCFTIGRWEIPCKDMTVTSTSLSSAASSGKPSPLVCITHYTCKPLSSLHQSVCQMSLWNRCSSLFLCGYCIGKTLERHLWVVETLVCKERNFCQSLCTIRKTKWGATTGMVQSSPKNSAWFPPRKTALRRWPAHPPPPPSQPPPHLQHLPTPSLTHHPSPLGHRAEPLRAKGLPISAKVNQWDQNVVRQATQW